VGAANAWMKNFGVRPDHNVTEGLKIIKKYEDINKELGRTVPRRVAK
jgi:hypothetical protein